MLIYLAINKLRSMSDFSLVHVRGLPVPLAGDLAAGEDDAADVAAHVVTDDDDGIVGEYGGLPVPCGDEVHYVGDGVVEAAEDEEGHSEDYRQDVFGLAVEPYGDVDDESAADSPEEGPPGALGEAACDDILGPLGRLAVERHHKEAEQHAGEDVEEPDACEGGNVVHNSRAAGVECRAGKDDANEPEGEYDGAGDAAEGEVPAGT